MNKSSFKLFLEFLKYLYPYRKKQVLLLLLSGVSVGLGLVNPYLSKLVVDQAILNKELRTFLVLGGIGGGIYILGGLAGAWMSLLERGLDFKLGFDLKRKVFGHLQGLPLEFFRRHSSADHVFKINYDIERVVDFLVSVPKELVNIFPKLFLTLAVIFYLNWRLAVFSFLLSFFLYGPAYYFTRKMRRILDSFFEDSQGIFVRLQESFSHIYLVKACGRQTKELRSFLRALIKNIRINARNSRLEVAAHFIAGSIERLLIGLIAFYGGAQVIAGQMTMGSLAAVMIYLSQLVGLQHQLAFFFQRFNFGLVSCRRLAQTLDEKPETAFFAPNGKIKFFREPKLQFKSVNFGYKPGAPVLEGLDFCMEKGFLALCGPSGCGKTTVVNLLVRLYEPWSGEILIEGDRLKDLNVFSVREQIGLCLQEPFLWNDTIENNIRYAASDAQRQTVIDTAKLCGVDEFAAGLPRGYETMVGENASLLSYGQKQKIALARAMLKSPKILVLDEAMSSMDSLSEEKIMRGLRARPDIFLVIVVSHRLSTVLACDLAYFFERPDQITIGKPRELLGGNVPFRRLFTPLV